MKPGQGIRRRQFLRDSTFSLGVAQLVSGLCEPARAERASVPNSNALVMRATLDSNREVWIMREPQSGFQEQLASRELARGLRNLGFARDPVQAQAGRGEPPASSLVHLLCTQPQAFNHPEAYSISQESGSGKAPRVRFTGATPQAVLYAVFDFLERQGAFFGLDGEVYPLEHPPTLNLPPAGQAWRAQPRFAVRGLMPWPNFLNCVTVFDREDWRAYLEAMLRMRFNMLGVHVFSSPELGAEPFLSFEYAGAGHLSRAETTATNRRGYLPERTSRYGMGSPDFFAEEVFGSEAATEARNSFEADGLAQKLWAEAFRYAKQLGIRTGVGFEPYKIPEEIYRATPPEARSAADPSVPGPRIDPESVTAKDILETRLASLLEAYPMVDYVWLWEDESMNWASQHANVPFSVTPFRQAYDFLKRHAPEKHLVVSGWGGVVRHFAYFHKALPEDVIFSALTDDLGWDPISGEYANLEGRERWPIPWLEDDPAMWLPQFHVARFACDMDLAERYGCQGLLGLHWRHRIVDANAGFQSEYCWNKELTPQRYFQRFASAQARTPRAQALAKVLADTDRDRLILCSWTGQIKNGHRETHGYSGDYNEGFQFWEDYSPPESVVQSHAQVAQQLRALTDAASSPAERDRLNYLTRFVEFVLPYSDSWWLAQKLHSKLQEASELKKQHKTAEARRLILMEGAPLWLKLAPKVREVFLDYQEIVSTRNDQGQLATMHNKYERLALFRLRASMKEFLKELPPDVERLFAETRRADDRARPRVFIPTRPTLLRRGESVRVNAVIPGPVRVLGVSLRSRGQESQPWLAIPMKLDRRRTYTADLQGTAGDGILLEYYVAAEVETGGASKTLTTPPEAPHRYHTVTLV